MNSYTRRKWAIRIIYGCAISLILAFILFLYLASQVSQAMGS